MEHRISIDAFYKNKSTLNGYVFYELCEDCVIVRQVIPSQTIKNLIKTNELN